jgi:hypothetical protein
MTSRETEIDRAAVAAAGLDRAMRLFPEDVAAAVAEATALRNALAGPLKPEDEPWEWPR